MRLRGGSRLPCARSRRRPRIAHLILIGTGQQQCRSQRWRWHANLRPRCAADGVHLSSSDLRCVRLRRPASARRNGWRRHLPTSRRENPQGQRTRYRLRRVWASRAMTDRHPGASILGWKHRFAELRALAAFPLFALGGLRSGPGYASGARPAHRASRGYPRSSASARRSLGGTPATQPTSGTVLMLQLRRWRACAVAGRARAAGHRASRGYPRSSTTN